MEATRPNCLLLRRWRSISEQGTSLPLGVPGRGGKGSQEARHRRVFELRQPQRVEGPRRPRRRAQKLRSGARRGRQAPVRLCPPSGQRVPGTTVLGPGSARGRPSGSSSSTSLRGPTSLTPRCCRGSTSSSRTAARLGLGLRQSHVGRGLACHRRRPPPPEAPRRPAVPTRRTRTSGRKPREPVRLEVHPLLRKSKFLAGHVDKLRSFVRARGGGGRCQRCLCPVVVIVQCVTSVGQRFVRRIPPKDLSLETKVFESLGVFKVSTSGRPQIILLRVLFVVFAFLKD